MEYLSIKEYLNLLKDKKQKVEMGQGNYFWITHEKFSVIRFPEFCTSEPTQDEIQKIFKKFKCLVINYTLAQNNSQQANSFLYNCHKNNYSSSKLSKNVRRDIRIGERNLCARFTDWKEIIDKGVNAFIDTRTKVGLSDGTAEKFKNRFSHFSRIPAHKAVAAWYGDEIAAFMSLIIVEDFVIIQGSFSTNKHKKFCPNNYLSDFILNHFLNKNNFKLVSYGLSSIQENNSNNSLHDYKIRIGFDEMLVQRVFVLNPKLKPFEIFLKKIILLAAKIFPQNRLLKKAQGTIRFTEFSKL